MSSEAKRVKILTLVEMFLGLALVVAGIVFVVGGASTAAPFVLCGEGALSLVFGARGALIANVPARIGKIVSLGLVVLLLQAACVAAIVFLVGPDEVADNLPPVCLSAVPALVTLVAVLLSRGMAKRAER